MHVHVCFFFMIKVRCFGERVGNTLRTWWTYWEPNGNLMGTYGNTLWTREKWKKILPPTNLKGKKTRHFDCMLGASHWLHEISLPKRVHQHFWPGLIYPLQRTPYLLISWGGSPKFVLFFFGKEALSRAHHNFFWNSQKLWCFPLVNFGWSIWHKSVILLGTFWGTRWELDGNWMGTKVWTHWKQKKTKNK